jgi:TIR domain-containing protein
MDKKTVFISYSHDSPKHSERVLQLAWALRRNGCDVELDQFHNEEIVDWPRWCKERTSREQSEFVVCVCTAEYRRRIEGNVPPEKGKGVYWEGALLDDDIYDDKGNARLIPLLLDDEPESSIPRFLRGWTHCRLSQFALSEPGYEHLLRILHRIAKVEKNEIGPVPDLTTKRAPVTSHSSARPDCRVDLTHFDVIKYAPADLIGREAETKLLTDTWDQAVRGEPKRPHVLTFVALGGEGKTSLVAKWAAELAYQDWPGCDAVFAWSFYSQGTREQTAVSSDTFLKEALSFFGDPAMAGSAQGAFDKGRRLARLVGERRALLILDGLEPLQYAPTSPTPGELKDQGLAALLKGLAATSLGLCVVTTRYGISDLRAFRQTTAPMHDLPRLSTATGVKLLRTIGVKTGSQADVEKLVEDVDGHALTLQILGQFLGGGPSAATSAAATASTSRKRMRRSRAATPSGRWRPMGSGWRTKARKRGARWRS